jgi:tetratricopeptide (TPR) repeat protein
MANTQMLQQQYGQYQQELGQYGQELNKYNMAADVYNRQAKEYQALVDAYKAIPEVKAYEAAVPAYNAAAEAYNKRLNDWNTKEIRPGNTPAKLYSLYANAPGAWQRGSWGQDLVNAYTPYLPGAQPTAPAALPANIAAQKPGEFTAAKPELTAVAPTDPGFTGQQMRQIQGQPTLAQQEMAGAQEAGLVERMRSGMNKQKPDSIIGGLLQNVRYST